MIAAEKGLATLRASPVFAAAPGRALEKLAAFARLERFDARTQICAASERLSALRYIVRGAIEVSDIDPDGRLHALAPMTAGAWATWLGCFQDAPLEHDLWAAEGTVTLAFPCAKVLSCARENPEIYTRVIAEIGARMRALMAWSLAFDQGDAVSALGRFLLATARAAGAAAGPQTLSLTHEKLAEAGLGSRQRAGRLLAALARNGLVTLNYGRIGIPNPRALQKFCDQSRL